MITAHSGCDRTEDNSLAFITYALSLPVDAFEVDIRKNSRGELILSHDETQDEAVHLSEAFELLKKHPEKKINCDLKQKHIEADVFSLAQKYGVENQLIFTGDVDPSLFKKGAAVYPQVAWFANLETVMPDFSARRNGLSEDETVGLLEEVLLLMKDYETAGLNWYFGTAEKIWEKAVALGIGISVWTVNDADQQKLWFDRNVENITSREISKLIALRDAR